MLSLDSINIYPKYMALYLSYGKYEAATESVPFDCFPSVADYLPPSQPIKLTSETTQIFDSVDNYWISDEIVNIISKRFFSIPAIEYIFLSIEDDLIGVITVINKYNKEIAGSIYNAEYDLLETFNDIFFDFFIIYREDRDIEDILPQESVVILRR